MAEKDQIDHDALAAEWGVALEAERARPRPRLSGRKPATRQQRRRGGLAVGRGLPPTKRLHAGHKGGANAF